MGFKKLSSRPPASLTEAAESKSAEVTISPEIFGEDVLIDSMAGEIHTHAMSTILDIIYGESYRNFEMALCEIGMDMSCLQTFQGYVYAMLLNKDFFNVPGAKSSRGLAMAIGQAAEYFYKETGLFGDFILSLDKFYQELLSEEEQVLYKPIEKSYQLAGLIDRILVRLHP